MWRLPLHAGSLARPARFMPHRATFCIPVPPYGLAAAIVITVAIIRGTLYADGRYISTGNPDSDRQAAGIKAFEA
jgi:hypothetical protein